MYKLIFLGGLGLTLNSFLWNFTVPAKEPLTLETALAEGKVAIEPSSLGAHMGKCVELRMTNLSRGKLEILIPAGAVFHPEDEGMQDIFVVEDHILALDKGAKIKRNIAGYCSQSSDRSPSAGTKFTFALHKNAKLQELAAYLNKNKFDDDVIQNAVWAVADNSGPGDIYAPDRAKIQPLRDLICKITGHKDVWYSTARNNRVDEQGYIQREPVSVSGMIAFSVDAPVAVKAKVKGKDNDLEYDLPGEINTPRAGKFEYDFNLRVRGWNKGKYEVIVMAGTRELLRQDFEL